MLTSTLIDTGPAFDNLHKLVLHELLQVFASQRRLAIDLPQTVQLFTFDMRSDTSKVLVNNRFKYVADVILANKKMAN